MVGCVKRFIFFFVLKYICKALTLPSATLSLHTGGVWDNLRRAGVVGDPLYRDNDVVYSAKTTAAYDNTTTKRWRFTRTFDAPAAVATAPVGSVVLLEFDGIQTLATVTLNGKPVLTTANQFRQYRAVLPNNLLVRCRW